MPLHRPRLRRLLRNRLRRALRRLDHRTPDWMQWLTPWGTSLALHALLVLALGIVLYAQSRTVVPRPPGFRAEFADQLAVDLSSLDRSEHLGDPFTREHSEDPPSIVLNPALADPIATNTPELPDRFRRGADLQLAMTDPSRPDRGSGAGKGRATSGKAGTRPGSGGGRGGDVDGDGDAPAPEPIAPFSGRRGVAKARLLRREGGTLESEQAVERGLDWLARHQRRDGSWSLDPTGECRGTPCPETPYGVSDSAATGLALLPMLGAGHVHTEKGRYQSALTRGLHWLVKHQRQGGELFTGGGDHTGFYSHAIATMALCEAYGMTKDPDLLEPARHALRYIIQTQNKEDGGWRYFPGQEGDTSVFGWEIFALRSGRMAGITVPVSTIRRCHLYLKYAATDQSLMFYSYKPGWVVSPSMTAEGLLCRQLLGWPREKSALVQGVAQVAAHLDGYQLRNGYYFYYATQLLHNQRSAAWPRWNQRVRDGLLGMQATGSGCDRGSWDPTSPEPDFWLARGGRLSVTALSLLTLEVYYRYLPMYRQPGDELDETLPGRPATATDPRPERGESEANNREGAAPQAGFRSALEAEGRLRQ